MKEIVVELDKCLGCKSCELACAVEHSKTKNLIMAFKETTMPTSRVKVEACSGFNFPLQCRHCQEPICVMACMTGALKKSQETGKVIQNKDKCVGCWMCVMVCPFGIITANQREKVALKCDRCPDRETPACVSACPTKALTYSNLNNFAAQKRKNYLVNFKSELVK